MAVETFLKHNLIARAAALREMALRAIEIEMASCQFVGGVLVVGARESRWPKVHFVVAGRAIASGELPLVGIVAKMAVVAARVLDWFFEIGGIVTAETARLSVLALQREPGARVIECLGHARGLPRRGGMTRLASFTERGLMRIVVAGTALIEAQAGVLDAFARRLKAMAFRTGRRLVAPG